MNKGLIILSFLLTNSIYFLGQYIPGFSNFTEVGLLYNPALAGGNENLSASVGLRTQWLGLEGSPTYLFFSSDLPTKRKRIGIGVNILNESIGLNNNNLINGNFAYKFLLSKGICSMGMSIGLKNSRLDHSQLNLIESVDPAFNNINNNKIYPYLGFGFSYVLKDFILNLGVMDLINESYSRNVNLSAQYKYELNNKLLMKSYVFYKKGVAKVNQMEIGTAIEYNRKLGIYFGYRTNQDFIMGVNINISKQLMMIYSYDFTTRYFSDFNNGSNELVLRFNFIEEKQAYSPKDF
jgi:type IX secretion system PorP/SprF family membrane protein